MTNLVLILALVVTMITPSLLHFGFKLTGKKMKTVLGLNIFSFAFILIAGTIIMLNGGNVSAETAAAAADASSGAIGMGYMAAALATGLAAIGAGIAVSSAASAAIGAISENPEVMGKALIFVALAEGIALYGLLISFTIIGKL